MDTHANVVQTESMSFCEEETEFVNSADLEMKFEYFSLIRMDMEYYQGTW